MSFCPKWVFEAACAAACADYINQQLDLGTISKSYATVLTGFYQPVSAEEIAGVIEPILRFLDELDAGDAAVLMVMGFCHNRVTFEQPNKPRKLKGIFGSADEAVKAREYSAESAVKSFKAYIYSLRNDVAELAPAGWKLTNVKDSDVLQKLANQNPSPLDFL